MARAFPGGPEQTEGFLYSFELGLEFKGIIHQKNKKIVSIYSQKKKYIYRCLRINIVNTMFFLGWTVPLRKAYAVLSKYTDVDQP